jgi:hypothetical protein
MVLTELFFLTQGPKNKYENPPVRGVQPMTALNTAASRSFQWAVKKESLFYVRKDGVRDRRAGVRIPVEDFLILKHVKTDYGAQIAFCAMGGPNRYSFLGVKRSGCHVEQSSPSSAEVEIYWSCTYTPPLRLHGVYGTVLPVLSLRNKNGKQ